MKQYFKQFKPNDIITVKLNYCNESYTYIIIIDKILDSYINYILPITYTWYNGKEKKWKTDLSKKGMFFKDLDIFYCEMATLQEKQFLSRQIKNYRMKCNNLLKS